MIRIGRFHQVGKFCKHSDDQEIEPAEFVTTEQLLSVDVDWKDSWGNSVHEGFLRPMSASMLPPERVRTLLEVLKQNFNRARLEQPQARSAIVDLDKIQRAVATILAAFLVSVCYYRNIEFIYSESTYRINGEDLKTKLSTEEFWHEVYNYPSKLFAVPLIPGRFDASRPKSVFVNGGLDFGRLLHLTARWEPQEIHLTYPEFTVSKKDPALISAFVGLIRSSEGIGRIDFEKLISSLEQWYESISGEDVQPMLVCGGWKLQSVLSSMWALENSRIPAFLCLPDFISPEVERTIGQRWRLCFTDTAVVV